MNRKIFAILIIVSLAIVSIGGVYAFSLGDIMDNVSQGDFGSKNVVTVNGIDFNVPDGFDEIITNSTKQYNRTVDDIPYFSTIKNYGDGNDTISISVCENEDHKATKDTARGIGGDSETINGVDGYLKFYPKNVTRFRSGNTLFTITYPPHYTFAYEQDGKLVVITTSEKDYISEVII